MDPSAETLRWFQCRNLVRAGDRGFGSDLPAEVAAYLLVTLAVRPDSLPEGVVTYLATRFFGHGTRLDAAH